MPPHAPALVVAVPGTDDASATDIPAEIRGSVAALYPGLRVHAAYLDDGGIDELLAELGEDPEEGPPGAVIVPLVTGPYPRVYDVLRGARETAGVRAPITEPLGPHPLLAQALHVRLAESGLARADRVRRLGLVTAADGVIVATVGGEGAVRAADMTAVLLASRLAVPVVPASLDGAPGLPDVAERLRKTGVTRAAIAPCIVGPEVDQGLLAGLAEEIGADSAAPLGTHPAVVRLVGLRYEVALEATDL
ncbi:MAG: hypothetical protein GEV03_08520 [Streptosporangiales bacterium]|nr:hypothetical protein [Streptosporangiales bacterium]